MIDLSADLGEGSPGEDQIWTLITSANVACGGHIGDEASMRDAARRARELGVRLGAHPSFPDRDNFGRKAMSMPADALRDSLRAQIGALRNIAAEEGVTLQFVKPHGALYNLAHHDRSLADIVISALDGLAIVCSDASQMAAAARATGLRVIREAFADRRYNADGSLVSRSEAGSLLSVDEAAQQAALLASEGAVLARDGSRIGVAFDTICVHADMEHAVDRLRAIRRTLFRDLA